MIQLLTIHRSGICSFSFFAIFIFAGFALPTAGATGIGPSDPYDDRRDASLSFNPDFLDTIPPPDANSDFLNRRNSNPYDLKDPDILNQSVEYDPISGQYILTEKIGENNYRNPSYLTFDEYLAWQAKKQEQAYFNNLTGVQNDFMTFSAEEDPIEQFDIQNDLINRLFGGTEIKVEPKGNIDITLGADYQKILNPNLPLRQQQQGPNFDFDMDINMGLNAKIGEKLDLDFNYNTNATFSFENKFKLKFDSEAFSEDDIIKNIEAGDVSLPLNSSLIQGNQSLFGLKTELQFGKLFLTTVISQQRSQQKDIAIQNGAQWQEFEIRADEYDENRHFLFSHYNRKTFSGSLQDLPQIQSLFRVTRAEVWVTSINNEYQDLRQIVALADLGEFEQFTDTMVKQEFYIGPTIPTQYKDKSGQNAIPDNYANGIYAELLAQDDAVRQVRNVQQSLLTGRFMGMQNGRDFEQRRARKLSPNRYTLIPELGVISLDAQLRPDEVLAVAYEYTYNGKNYQVGEFSSDVPEFSSFDSTGQVIFVKMLKSSTQQVDIPMYDLMMKNFYSIGAYQASEEDFQFDIYYDDPGSGFKRYLPESEPFNKPLLTAFNLDQLNFYGDPAPDGFFDFIPGITINTRTGKVMFPVLEPFGQALLDSPGLNLPPNLYAKYEYEDLYEKSIFAAQEFQEKNRFVLRGSYKSSISNEISLGSFNLPPNSVTVRSGGVTLRENVDYVVDYQIGRVRIINDAYAASGAPITASFEDRTLFGINRQSMLGLRADYKLSKKVNIGGTFMKLWERPFTEKVNYGNDPINNNIYGLDFAYSDDAPWLTKAVDALPLISTKEKSNIDFYVEGAVLKPGHSKAINVGDDEGGVVYIDDFEGTSTGILLANQINRWSIASVPQGLTDPGEFPEGALNDDVRIGANRALLNWYRIEGNVNPSSSDPYQKYYSPDDIFKGTAFANNFIDFRTFDVRYYPSELGPYNFDVPGGHAGYTAGLVNCTDSPDGEIKLADPETRWAGIMREIDATNFEAANVQALEFWVLNPFINNASGENNGQLTFQIGNISEDILKDGLAFYENALDVDGNMTPSDKTNLGKVPSLPPVIFAFANDKDDRPLQDVGLDGYNDADEVENFSEYYNAIKDDVRFGVGCLNASFGDAQRGSTDLAHDNYKWFADESFTGATPFFDRYLKYNGLEGNSPIVTTSNTFSNSFTSTPDAEDINEDGSSERSETYFQYEIPLINNGSRIDEGPIAQFITDVVDNTASSPGELWYRFKIPLTSFTDKVGSIPDFRSIKFIRMITSDFEQKVTFRFAKMEFTRNQWRRVERNISKDECGDQVPGEIDVNVVNIEEHGGRLPFQYVLPPGIDREENFQSAFRGTFLNEQSLALELCNHYCGVRGVYKNLGMNMREYERLKLFTHIESDANLKDKDVALIIRMGSDYVNNYYEYKLPLDFSEEGETSNDPDVVWKDSNRVNLVLQDLKQLKLNRTGLPNEKYTEPYFLENGTLAGEISVIGSPNLGDVKTMFLGLEVEDGTISVDYCANAWINELRLVGLNESGGAAALGRLDMQLADLGNVALSGNVSGIGWGSIDKQLLERQQEKIVGYDAATNLELDKFLGDKSRLKLPFFAQYSNTKRTPKYDPYDRDLTVQEKQASDNTYDIETVQDRTVIKTVSMNNVRLERKPEKKVSLPWDVSNFSASYTQTSTEHSDPILSQDDSKQQTGSLDYQYNTGSKPIEPFKKLIKTDKWIKFIKDINFNPIPGTISIRNSLDRRQRNRQFRSIGEGDPLAQATSRQFLWNRDYRVGWDLTKSIKFNYFATNVSAIDELNNDGIDLFGNNVGVDNSKKYLRDNLKDFGRTKTFNQNFDLSYKLPFSKFGILDWITTDLRYSANYNWTAGSINNAKLGNSISNGNDGSVRVNMNFERLYNKSKFLAGINRGKQAGNKKVRSNGPQVADKDDKSKDKKKTKSKEASTAARVLLRPLMMIRRARFNYSETNSSYVPGINKTPEYLGLSSGFEAPGWRFIGGFAPENNWLLENANGASPEMGYFVNDICVNQEFNRSYTEKWDAQVSIEPLRDFKLDIKVDKSFTNSESSLFKYRDEDNDFGFGDWSEFGSYKITYLTTKTLFQDGEANINALFGTFKQNLSLVSERVDQELGDPSTGPNTEYPTYAKGFGPTQQQVIIPSFIAAYKGEDAATTNLNVFNESPLPNWTLTYNGITKIPWFKERFSRFSLSHTYTSTLTINQFNTDLRYAQDDPRSNANTNPITQDYYSRLTIPQVVIAEGMSPIIKVDITTINDLSINFELGKNRTLSLDPDNQQINETRATSWAAGFGYTLKNVYIGFIPGAKKQKAKRPTRGGTNTTGTSGANSFEGNTLKISCDFSLKDDRTIQHLWGLDVSARATRGQKAMTISPALDYTVNEYLTMRLFFDYRSTEPYTELSYPITNARGGLRLRFALK